MLLGGGDQGRLDGLEHDLLVDILFAMKRIDDSEHVRRIHGQALISRDQVSGFRRQRSIPGSTFRLRGKETQCDGAFLQLLEALASQKTRRRNGWQVDGKLPVENKFGECVL